MDKQKRNRYLVDSSVQFSLVRRIVLHWLAFAVLFLSLVIAVESGFRGPGTSISQVMVQTLEKYAMPLMIMIALLPVFLYDTIKLSNRFAGPICRLRKGLSALAKCQETSELRFRKGDFWVDLADDFNRVANRLGATTGTQSTSPNAGCGDKTP